MQSRPTTPLLTLGRRLTRQWPPSLRVLGYWLTAGEPYGVFKRLLQEYLPDKQAEILALPHEEMSASFSQHFQERYFPLIEVARSGDLGMERLVTAMPLEVFGIHDNEYDELVDAPPERVVATLFVDISDVAYEGVRITLLEKAEEWLPRAILERFNWSAEGGRPPFELGFLQNALLDKPQYRGLVFYGERLLHCSGYVFLDATMDELYGYGCRSTGPPEWDPEAVSALTSEWEECQTRKRDEDNFFTWMAEDIRAHTQELLEYLEGKWKESQKKQT